MRITKLPVLLFLVLFLGSCQKDISSEPRFSEKAKAAASGSDHGHLVQTKAFPDDVAEKWLDMELRLTWSWSGNPYGLNGDRFLAYLGVALYESVVPGMPAYLSLDDQLNGMPDMPETVPGTAYYWPASANAAMAYLQRAFFTAATPELKRSIDSLEGALNTQYKAAVDAETFARSVAFGTEVARRILEWSKTDGAASAACAYTPSTEVGKWNTTNPITNAKFTPFVPCWGQNRAFVPGSTEGTYEPLPPAYSEDPNSAYYAMVKEVYDASLTLTQAQKDLAKYFLDQPGYPSGTQYIYIFRQVVGDEDMNLAETAVATAQLGLALAEAQRSAWQQKYALLVDRPVRYIREVIGDYIPAAQTWTPLFATPAYPEFPAGHPQTAGAFGEIMETIFGENYAITLHTYDVIGLAPLSFSSFDDLVASVGWARVYSGIHYTYTVEASAKQGAAIAENILEMVDFHKGEGKP